MRWKILLSLIFFLMVVVLLIVYWFIPKGTIEFIVTEKNTNFTLNANESQDMQFYENMRFPKQEISYQIEEGCPLKKTDDMERAFEIIETSTMLNFYSVFSNEEISVTCDSTAKVKEGLFIAGEGGPVNITKTDNFNVILKGSILLIKDSKCSNPNIAIHELLHVLGFDHSENSRNIMYPVSKCNQEIGQDTIDLINQIYAYPSLPDLSFQNVSAKMNGRYLDINITVRNNGLKDSEPTEIIISSNDKQIKQIEIQSLEIGYGSSIFLTNIFVLRSVNELDIFINYSSEELNKDDNLISLKIKE